jgi:hypothetical protein
MLEVKRRKVTEDTTPDRISGPDRLVYINLLAAAQPGLRLCVDPRRYIPPHLAGCRP